MSESSGRRERKKAGTRTAIADAAFDLFLERGYDQVGIREVADSADVSVTTLFKYFPHKEALVFDLDEQINTELAAVIRDRLAGQTVPQAILGYAQRWVGAVATYPHNPAYTNMVENTQVLRDYAHGMWLRHSATLARAVAEDIGVPQDDVTCAALARFALEAIELAYRHPDPPQAAAAIFALLDHGWAVAHPSPGDDAAGEPGG